MFLVDSALAAQDWQKILDEVQRVLDRAGAEVVSLKKWDERRLCYDIQGKSRGTYILVYFNCDTEKVKGVERDVQLSELITRVLILRTDRMSQDDIDRPTPLEASPVSEEGDESSPETDSTFDSSTDSKDTSEDDDEKVDDSTENA